jgi:hypothetical protein
VISATQQLLLRVRRLPLIELRKLSTLSHRTSFALLVNPTHPALAEPVVRGVQAEARTLGIELHLLHLLHASSDSDLDAAFATAARLQAAGRRCAPLMPSGPQIRGKKLPYILKLFVRGPARCRTTHDIRLGVFDRTAGGTRSSVHRVLNLTKERALGYFDTRSALS